MADWTLTRRDFTGLLAAAAAIAPLGLAAQDAPVKIVATTGMIADAARQIGQDLVDVRALMGPGVDPHSYRQTRSDILSLTKADLVLWHGLYLEAQMQEFLLDLAGHRQVVAVAEVVPRDLLRAHDNYADKFDPHVWMDPNLWALVVTGLRDTMMAAMPAHAETLAENAQRHLDDIAALAGYAASTMATVPVNQRVLVTAHDAFNYFGRAYGLSVQGIQGMSTESEAGLNRITELVDLLVSQNVQAVFVESSVSDRNMRALVEGAAARGHTVSIGGQLFSDAMGADGTYEGTYLGMIDHNVTTIARALGGDAPLAGHSGKLGAVG